VIKEYRIKYDGQMEILIKGLEDEWIGYRIHWIAVYKKKREELLI
jgi:hypothetical protein